MSIDGLETFPGHPDAFRHPKEAHITSRPRANPDRHKDGSKVVAVRIPMATYEALIETMGRSPLTHDTVGGYIAWLIDRRSHR